MLISLFGRFANGLFAVVGTALAAQIPAFYRQYLQRLGGRLEESTRGLERVRADAAANGETLANYISNSINDVSPRAKEAGLRALDAVEANQALARAYEALTQATPFTRPLALAEHFDPDLAQGVLKDFSPAVDLSPEGLIYAGIGFLLGLLLLGLLQQGAMLLGLGFAGGRGRADA